MDNLPNTQTPEPAQSHDLLFRPIIGRHLPDLYSIADAARADFEAGAEYEAPLPTATPEELRAHLRELAPVVHSQLWQVQMLETNYEIPGVSERNGIRAQTPPLFAHFALTALALIEAEADEAQRSA
jgi:hypothetical protein